MEMLHRLPQRTKKKRGYNMRRTLIIVLSAALSAGVAFAQNTPPNSDTANNPVANSAVSQGTKAPSQPQPQGQTGPTTTKSGGEAAAESPQGDSPPGMQPDPGDPKQNIDPKK
jgi:cytoskeletal protein RodZ